MAFSRGMKFLAAPSQVSTHEEGLGKIRAAGAHGIN